MGKYLPESYPSWDKVFFLNPHKDIFWGMWQRKVYPGQLSILEGMGTAADTPDSSSSGTVSCSLWMDGATNTHGIFIGRSVCRGQLSPGGLKAFYGHYLTYPSQPPGRWREERGSQPYRLEHQSEIHKACFKKYQ